MKTLEFLGDTLRQIRQFPAAARSEAGHQLLKVQNGEDPSDWKPLPIVGIGVREIRIRDETGAFRIIYLASDHRGIFVLHAFQKKTEQTDKRDIDVARRRFRQI